MSKESLEQFMEKVGSNEELRASVENQLDSDGNISVDALIALGSENGCEFTFEDLQQTAELSNEELDGVAGGYAVGGSGSVNLRRKLHILNEVDHPGGLQVSDIHNTG
jgi:predicted ribosomally synthesized peptide with nif11-like leader